MPIPATSFSPSLRLCETIAQTVTPSSIPSPDVAHLRSRYAKSGYVNVYESGRWFIAKVKEGGKLRAIRGSKSIHPHQAAAFVVAWYRARFGSRWLEALKNRTRPYWKVKYSERWSGWLLTVWVNGRAMTVSARNADGRPLAKPLVLPTRSQAFAFAKLFLPKRRDSWAAWREPRQVLGG